MIESRFYIAIMTKPRTSPEVTRISIIIVEEGNLTEMVVSQLAQEVFTQNEFFHTGRQFINKYLEKVSEKALDIAHTKYPFIQQILQNPDEII